jgi:hypothetical protein
MSKKVSVQITFVVCGVWACCACAAGFLPTSDQVLSPTYKGGMAVGEIIEVTTLKKEGDKITGVIRMKISEVIGGSIKLGEVQIDFSRRTSGDTPFDYRNPWAHIEPRVELQVIATLTEQKSVQGWYWAETVALLEKVSKEYLHGQRQIAALLKIENIKDRLTAMDSLEFRIQLPNVQTFILKQIAQFKNPSIAIDQIAPIFHNTQCDYGVRWQAGVLIRHLMFDLTSGQENRQAIDTLTKGLQDPTAGIRDLCLQSLKYVAACEDPERGTFKINQRVIDAIESLLKTEKNESVRKHALAVQKHIRDVLAKMKSGR